MVDVLGLILAVAVTGANVQDRDGGQLVLKGLKDRFPRLARVWADGVYAGRLVALRCFLWVTQSVSLAT